MRTIFNILLLLLAGHLYSQTIDQVGQLKLSHAKIIQVDTVSEDICGQTTKAIRLTVIAKTEVQLSCNYGDPSKNIYDTVKNKVYIYYAYDTAGVIHTSLINEIKEYVTQQEAWAQQYNSGKDFTHLGFTKSFYVNGETTIPFIWTGAENPGDYQLFYLNKQVYKIAIAERNGLGCLSLFVEQNMYFTKSGQRIDLGQYIKNTDIVRQIIAKH
jgi:hypothetical protein